MSDNPPPIAGPGTTDPLSSIDARIRSIEEETRKSRAAIQSAPDPMAQQRDWIAKAIIWVFVTAVGIGLLILLLEGIMDRSSWSNVAAQSADLIKSTVLPIVTLVLGYYFGQASKS